MAQTEKTTNPRKTNTSASASSAKVKALEKQLEDMKKQMELITNSLSQSNTPVKSNVSIDYEEDIDVISLCTGPLRLATGGLGQGEIYKFEEYGEVVPIPFKDLKEILRNNKSFYEKGYFSIDSTKAVSALKIAKIAEKLPTVEDLTNIFKKDVSTAGKILKMTTKQQKEMLAYQVVEKLMHDENSIDYNLVKLIGDSVDEDLVSAAKAKNELISGGE